MPALQSNTDDMLIDAINRITQRVLRLKIRNQISLTP